jgi:hypothetical protein
LPFDLQRRLLIRRDRAASPTFAPVLQASAIADVADGVTDTFAPDVSHFMRNFGARVLNQAIVVEPAIVL